MQIQPKRDLAILRTFIRSERLRRNISQEKIAGYLNISQNSYSKLEIGCVPISVEQLLVIGQLFEMRPIDLLHLERLRFVLQLRERKHGRTN